MKIRVKNITSRKWDIACALLVAMFIAACFYRTILFASPISRVFLLATKDVLFRTFATNRTFYWDESLYSLLVPYYFLDSHFWQHGEIPLWNPFSGFGQPLIGDLQSAPFSPWRLIFSFNPTFPTYNTLLVGEIVVSGIASFYLARALGLSRCTAIFSACAYSMCPLILRYMELLGGTSTLMMPLLFLPFVALGKNPSARTAMMSGLAAALFIITGHPEWSFIGIVSASLLSISIGTTGNTISAAASRALGVFRMLALSGLTAFCLSAFALLPFVEFLINSNCYKFDKGIGSITANLPALLLNIIHPYYREAAPFMGALFLPLIALGFSQAEPRRKTTRALFIVFVFTAVLACRPEPLRNLIAKSIFGIMPGTYYIPIYLLMGAMAAGFGLEEITERLHIGKNKRSLIFLASVLSAIIIPLVFWLCKFDLLSISFDPFFAPMSFSKKSWITGTAMLLILTFVIALRSRLPKPKLVVTALAMVFTFISIGVHSKNALPPQPVFAYKESEPLKFLRKAGERMTPLGSSILLPNSNVAFEVPSISSHNVMFPERYKAFMAALGARICQFTYFIDEGSLSPLIDLAGIRYVLSLSPVWSDFDKNNSQIESAVPLATVRYRKSPQIEFRGATLAYNERNSEISGHVQFQINASCRKRYAYVVVVARNNAEPLWFSGFNEIGSKAEATANEGGIVNQQIKGLVPLSLPPGEKFSVGIKILDLNEQGYLEPEIGSVKDNLLVLNSFAKQSPDSSSTKSNHFDLVQETAPYFVRIYRNNHAVPHAYIVHSVVSAKSEDEIIPILKSQNFQPRKQVVLEGYKPTSTSHPARDQDSAEIVKQEATNIEIKTTSIDSGILVLTDIFYPGWQASIDGKDVSTYRANYLFRGVEIPGGEHRVRFRYQPVSFFSGAFLAVSFAIGACLFLVRTRKNIKTK